MAIWAGSNINTNETAMLFNQLATRKSISGIRKKNGFLYAVTGMDEPGATPGASAGFKRHTKVSGLKIEWRTQGEHIGAPTFRTKASATDSVSLTHNANVWGGQEVMLAFLTDTIPIPHHELDRFRGDELKTENYLQDVYDAIELDIENKVGTQLAVTGATGIPGQTDTDKLGSWPYAIEGVDGAWTDSSDDYGTLARDDSTNSWARGLVYASVGDLTLAKIRTAKNDIILNGGAPRFGVAGGTVYGRIEHLVEQYTQVMYDEKWSKFGGEHVKYAGIAFTLDYYAPSGYLGIMDPETWHLWENDKMPFTKGVVNDPTKVATYVIQYTKWLQNLCLEPRKNAVLKGITG